MKQDEDVTRKQRDPALDEPIRQLTKEVMAFVEPRGATPVVLYSMQDAFIAIATRAMEAQGIEAEKVSGMLSESQRKFTRFTKKKDFTGFETRVLRAMAPLKAETTGAQLCRQTNCLRDSLDACMKRLRDRGLVHRDVRAHVGYFTLTAEGQAIADKMVTEEVRLPPGALIRTPITSAFTRAPRAPTQPKR